MTERPRASVCGAPTGAPRTPTWRATLLGVTAGPATRGAPGWREVLEGSPTGVGLQRVPEAVG